jgi:CheY-like chemotaxis protein
MNYDSINNVVSEDLERANRKQILIVEDDPQWKLILSKAVGAVADSPEIVYAGSAEMARAILASDKKFDLVISDYILEGDETGVELWHSAHIAQTTPFVLISGKSVSEIHRLSGGDKSLPMLLSKLAPKAQLKSDLERALNNNSKKPQFFKMTPAVFIICTALIFFAQFLLGTFLAKNSHAPSAVSYVRPKLIEIHKKEMPAQRPRLSPEVKSAQPIRINQIITPELKEKINRIARRADQVNRHFAASDALVQAAAGKD